MMNSRSDHHLSKRLPSWVQRPKVHHLQAQAIQDPGQLPDPVKLKEKNDEYLFE